MRCQWIKDHQAVYLDLFKYVEIFYNRKRQHDSLGNLNPMEFEQQFELNQEQTA